jgi:hypothetical protein
VRSLEFGTRFLRQMIDRFDGRVERAVAAYNAGPGRVVAWTAARPDMPAEEFIEIIPFTETRGYVMGVLAHREQYRRLYALPAPQATHSGQLDRAPRRRSPEQARSVRAAERFLPPVAPDSLRGDPLDERPDAQRSAPHSGTP